MVLFDSDKLAFERPVFGRSLESGEYMKQKLQVHMHPPRLQKKKKNPCEITKNFWQLSCQEISTSYIKKTVFPKQAMQKISVYENIVQMYRQ